MPARRLNLSTAPSDAVHAALAAARAQLGIPPMFSSALLDEAKTAAARSVDVHGTDGDGRERHDHRDIEFVTIDPPGSMDLDQAIHIAPSGDGFVVRYAVADVAAFVTPGSGLDEEAHRRGMTVYGPDMRTPLYPQLISEGAASLLPGEDRPAAVWTIGLDSRGEITSTSVVRAIVRSRERLSYGEVQSLLDGGLASPSLQLLATVGALREEREWERGGVSLHVPEQEVAQLADHSFSLSFRRTLPVEGWNAQISLLVGMAAAGIMRSAGVALLRTLPPADDRDIARLWRTATALGIEWPTTVTYAELLHQVESRKPTHAAFLAEATTLFRGAGYVAFGLPGLPSLPGPDLPVLHAAIGAEYAHVTAPLRRLADRYAAEICLSYCSGRDVPRWVVGALPSLPATMAAAGVTAAQFEHACVDIVEAALLEHRVGQQFDGVIVDVSDAGGDGTQRGEVVLRTPAVRARVDGVGLPLGERVRVTLAEASIAQRHVRFAFP